MGKSKYGIDAPHVPLLHFIFSIINIAIYVVFLDKPWSIWPFAYGIASFVLGAIYMHTTLSGKFKIWENIFRDLNISQDAKILDMGCGSGMVLIMAAKKIGKQGKVFGVDIWRNVDQSKNEIIRAQQNATIEGVNDKINLQTADITDLPFDNESFDYITGSMVLHNIKGKTNRKKALNEAVRVLKKKGIIVIADIKYRKEYVSFLKSISMKIIVNKDAGWKGWWAGPWVSTKIIIAKK